MFPILEEKCVGLFFDFFSFLREIIFCLFVSFYRSALSSFKGFLISLSVSDGFHFMQKGIYIWYLSMFHHTSIKRYIKVTL